MARNQLASVGKATYSLPHRYVGQVVTARADAHLVRFYARGLLIKPIRKPAGGQRSRRAIIPSNAAPTRSQR